MKPVSPLKECVRCGARSPRKELCIGVTGGTLCLSCRNADFKRTGLNPNGTLDKRGYPVYSADITTWAFERAARYVKKMQKIDLPRDRDLRMEDDARRAAAKEKRRVAEAIDAVVDAMMGETKC